MLADADLPIPSLFRPIQENLMRRFCLTMSVALLALGSSSALAQGPGGAGARADPVAEGFNPP